MIYLRDYSFIFPQFYSQTQENFPHIYFLQFSFRFFLQTIIIITLVSIR